MFREVYEQLKQDWKTSKLMFLLEIVGTLLSMTASTLLAVNTVNIVVVYIVWQIGTISLVFSSHMRRSYWIFLLMVFYTVVIFIGLYRHW